jgi:hypothetical protein
MINEFGGNKQYDRDKLGQYNNYSTTYIHFLTFVSCSEPYGDAISMVHLGTS